MRLLLGHNQFIGVSHTSEDRSRGRDAKFSKVENIYYAAEAASELGYEGMMIETHPRMLEFFEYYNKNRTFDMNFYLQAPYVQGYIRKMNEEGIHGLISDMIHRKGFISTSKFALKSVISPLKKNYLSIALSALKFEVAPFAEAGIKTLLLHNVVTDLLISLGVSDAFSEYSEYVKDELGLEPGFITSNFPLLQDSFKKWGIPSSFIMTPVNLKGYNMNPSKGAVEDAIRTYKGEIIAMNVLGGGAFSVKEAYSYLKSFDNINYCVIGASSKEHLKELMEVFGETHYY
jgi:hypothetical protein